MATAAGTDRIAGRNGVVINKRPHRESYGYRTYEVYQRERVGESTEKIRPIQLISDDYRQNPYPLLEILRENYPCYRDWLSNSYRVTRYNDVTSIFTDDANFETRPATWYAGLDGSGRNLGEEVPVLAAEEALTDRHAKPLADALASALLDAGDADLATGFAASFAMKLRGRLLDLPESDLDEFASIYWRMHRGLSWVPRLQQDGRIAIDDMIAYLAPIVEQRRSSPGEDMLSAMLQCQLPDGPVTTEDIVVTLLEGDHETLHGTLANLWFLLLTHPDELDKARADRRLMKLACLETLRHSTPVIVAERFARHEVERFGRLIPEGARLICSAAAANRDPRVFRDPDSFTLDRKDICQREPRGHYRADGLASGIVFKTGKPTRYPAVPEDRPRSRYAILRDTVVTASRALSEACADISLAPGQRPNLASLTVGEMHSCWKLPVKITRRRLPRPGETNLPQGIPTENFKETADDQHPKT